MRLQTVAAERIAPVAWRNGGGRTRELLAWPDPQAWALRVSLAEIAADGDFSAWPGLQRWFAVVAGAGVVLRWPGGRRELLAPGSPPLSFDGGEPPHASLLEGPVLALNLMLQGGQGALLPAEPGAEWRSTAAWRGCFVAAPARLQIDDADAAQLPALGLAGTDHGRGQRWRLLGEQPGWWLHDQPEVRR